MNSESTNSLPQPSAEASDVEHSVPIVSGQETNPPELASVSSSTSSWALKLQQSLGAVQESPGGIPGMSAFARLARGFGSQMPLSVDTTTDHNNNDVKASSESGVFESLTKGFVDSSRSAVKAVQVKARHIVSQNKRRYQEGGFDLDMTYITENIIAMGFPAGSLTSGFFGYLEGFYRNHMEEVIKFFETHHKGKYKVYNLCSERLYDASLFEGKVATFPFDDHNCPPIQLITSFCQSAYSWLKEDIQNVVVVHCKAGMARTGLMICSLLLFLKFFPTAEEAMDYYNQKRCVDGKALTLPSQIRYVKYFERILTEFKGENQPGRRCMLRGFRIHKCPYWIRPSITISNHNGILFSTKKHPKTKDLMPEDFWMKASRKGIVVFALPGEPGLTELVGDFKIHFHERQGDFYCWLNTTMSENRMFLGASELDGFDKRKLPSPGFQVEIVMIDYDGTLPQKSNSKANSTNPKSDTSSSTTTTTHVPISSDGTKSNSDKKQVPQNEDNDDVFSDSDGDEKGANKSRATAPPPTSTATLSSEQVRNLSSQTDNQLSLGTEARVLQEGTNDTLLKMDSTRGSDDFKAMAADASVFSFGDDEDFESD
ncbi:phosphatidylinositol 3,4,5-trisphosphate 3-phosphatase and protein-tyrosine-phosphatase PTEN2A [Cannabis sativa]|uniref:phosphatidylinositol 3,4,5-trisphosphate 3-phosphatase and protein-tyrosine-phosphatase PTEN2A n=1 Tax=Cannabis sativa TaxID=3483 RepID=UPI0029CA5A8C|nr:phosphatidylinositol 3,4,5-trisphosphate 3-phosphatase and protein-tyrosine-phosphatase PTEN2A [Cannabis sativa]XP_060961140.1 phosphatidylinositol 3,4,5-trisphosphate 3-phosphatase and protein-tyrosine-phosphatase PTEN2A [Cannabis sativa]